MTTHQDLITLGGQLEDALPASVSKKVRTLISELNDAILNLESEPPMPGLIQFEVKISEAQDSPTQMITLEGDTLAAVQRYLAWDAKAGLDFENQQSIRDADRAQRASMSQDDIVQQGNSRQQAALDAHLQDARAANCQCYAHQRAAAQQPATVAA